MKDLGISPLRRELRDNAWYAERTEILNRYSDIQSELRLLNIRDLRRNGASAYTERFVLFQPVCADCHWSGALTPSEDASDAQSDAHDNAEHNPLDRSDDA